MLVICIVKTKLTMIKREKVINFTEAYFLVDRLRFVIFKEGEGII